MMKLYILLTLVVFQLSCAQTQVDSILEKGFSDHQCNHPEIAISDARKIIANPEATARQKMRAYQLMSGSYSVMGKNRLSLHSSFKAKEIADQLNDPYISAVSLCWVAECYRRLDLNHESLENYKNALVLLDQIPATDKSLHTKAIVFYEIGNTQYNENQYRSAAGNYTKSLAILKNLKKDAKRATAETQDYLLLGGCYLFMKKYDSAEICFKKTKDIAAANKNTFIMPYLMESYAKLYDKQENYRKAVDYAEKGVQLMDFQDTKLKRSLHELLAKCYGELGDVQNARKNYSTYIKLNDDYTTEKNNAVSLAFKQAKTGLKKEIAEQKNDKMLLGYVLIFLIIASAIIIFLYRQKARKNRLLYTQTVDRLVHQSLENTIPARETSAPAVLLSEEKEQEILQKLEEFEKSERVTHKKLTIASLAASLGTNVTYLSNVISRHKAANFNHYINNLKITYIVNKLYTEPNYRNYKITYLAEECGLPYSSFTSVFKSITGMSPSAFIKQMNEDKDMTVKYL
ncbi:AraC family transcriptional regulator [uncultured Chryseobacterium sp.]|uniref:AraC family transcriptional regulator n=1 Tax=uncultured Chryseobacterium sp. TaxID=259322 RepID=UPI0025F26C90|nr:AraC family transcriptional regulator [uncultured Chryseobacterium sp.]